MEGVYLELGRAKFRVISKLHKWLRLLVYLPLLHGHLFSAHPYGCMGVHHGWLMLKVKGHRKYQCVVFWVKNESGLILLCKVGLSKFHELQSMRNKYYNVSAPHQ